MLYARRKRMTCVHVLCILWHLVGRFLWKEHCVQINMCLSLCMWQHLKREEDWRRSTETSINTEINVEISEQINKGFYSIFHCPSLCDIWMGSLTDLKSNTAKSRGWGTWLGNIWWGVDLRKSKLCNFLPPNYNLMMPCCFNISLHKDKDNFSKLSQKSNS